MRKKDFWNMKRFGIILLSSSMMLSGCSYSGSSAKKMEETVAVAAKSFAFEKKETKYQLDETTEVLIDKKFKKDDIIKVVKHGDHWHVWTKDNEEHITYTDPALMDEDSEIEAVNVVSGDSLSESGDEVVKILKHGDHYHIFTASGKEYISYENPRASYPKAYFGEYEGEHGDEEHREVHSVEEQIIPAGSVKSTGKIREKVEKLEIVTVFGQKEVDRFDIVKILKHGDHYHIYDTKGREGILYSNPSSLYPTAFFGEYEGEHGAEKKEDKKDFMKKDEGKKASKEKKETEKQATAVDKNKVVKILQHGDHYHIYTAGGEEFISYENPREKFPDAVFGQYEGSHGEEKKDKKEVNREEKEKKKKRKKNKKKVEKKDKETKSDEKKEEKEENVAVKKAIEELSIVNLLGQTLVDRFDIVKILQHGDHYHIYDSKGNEGILYVNPKALYPNAVFGQYEGSHGEKKEEKKEKEEEKDKKEEAAKEAEGTGSAKNNDGSRVVRILVHGDHYHVYTADGREFITYSDPSGLYPDASFGVYTGSHGDEKTPEKTKEISEKTEAETSTESGSGTASAEAERNAAIRRLSITGILGKGEVNRFDIVKILQHEDHYHIFDSNNNEGIVRTNPKDLYPKASFGQYEGSHGGKSENAAPIKWPEGITRIIDHGDHWHLIKDGVEVAVVDVNPREKYPDAEYIEEKAEDKDVKVEDSELFTYDEITPMMTEGISERLDDNLKSMTHFGTVPSGRVYGSNGETTNVFYWLHYDHYHAITIKQIVVNAKLGKYGKYTAREVVAALKAKIVNKEAFATEVVDGSKNDAIKKYLEVGFNLQSFDVEIIGNDITVYIAGGNLRLRANDFEERDGFIRSKIALNGFVENNVKVMRYGRSRGSTGDGSASAGGSGSTGDGLASAGGSNNAGDGTSSDRNDISAGDSNPADTGSNENTGGSSTNTGTSGMADAANERENLKKLADIFYSSEEDAFDFLFDFMDMKGVDRFRVAELEIDVTDRTITLNGTSYVVPADFGA